MLLQELRIAYSEFSEFCLGRPSEIAISFNDICDRLNKYNEIIKVVLELEAQHEFSDANEEIIYYKEEKPALQQFGIYYQLIYQIELKKRPLAFIYYRRHLKKLDEEFDQIEQYVVYHRSNDSTQDEVYFNRKSNQNHIIALVMANDMLVEYLNHKAGSKSADEIIANALKVKFNLSQNAIMEISKGMKGIGAAEGTLKDIAEYLGRCMGVDMKNVYGKSHVISNRMTPTKFLDRMRNWLINNL